jgi:putative transposase
MATRGVPEHIRRTTGRSLPRRRCETGLKKVGVKTLFIEPGSPWENGYCESLNGKLRDELLDREIFYTLLRRGC